MSIKKLLAETGGLVMEQNDRAPGLIDASIRWNVESSKRNLATERFVNRWTAAEQVSPFATFDDSTSSLANTSGAEDVR